jgi:hypothetical protein
VAVIAAVVAACGSTPIPPTSFASPTVLNTPTTGPTGTPTASSRGTALTREAAIALAQKAAPAGYSKAVLGAAAGPFKDLGGFGRIVGTVPAPEDWVWRVNLGEYAGPTGGSGTTVVLDYYDGHLILISNWVG